jgi:hypothetical protein
MVPLSHTPNQDGYFRFYAVDYYTRLPMMYRVIWEMRNGPIPDGYEVDHVCRCRGCINPDHLRMIDGTEHAIQSNRNRYKETIEEGKKLLQDGYSVEEVASQCNRKIATVKKWSKGLL